MKNLSKYSLVYLALPCLQNWAYIYCLEYVHYRDKYVMDIWIKENNKIEKKNNNNMTLINILACQWFNAESILVEKSR